jgi:hypothetical protein
MAYTQDDLDALDQRIATGELSWAIDGRRTEYRSLEEMMTLRAFIARQLEAASTRAPRPRYQVAVFADD